MAAKTLGLHIAQSGCLVAAGLATSSSSSRKRKTAPSDIAELECQVKTLKQAVAAAYASSGLKTLKAEYSTAVIQLNLARMQLCRPQLQVGDQTPLEQLSDGESESQPRSCPQHLPIGDCDVAHIIATKCRGPIQISQAPTHVNYLHTSRLQVGTSLMYFRPQRSYSFQMGSP